MNTILICLIICSVYSFIIYKILSIRINRKIDNKTFLKEVREEVNSLVTQINETSDRNVFLIENRLERLSKLIAISDQSMADLKKINKSRKQIDNEIKEEPAVSKPITIVEVIDEAKPEEVRSEIEDDESLSTRDRILLLHRQGISPTVIASQTKSTIGEVELIISLSRS